MSMQIFYPCAPDNGENLNFYCQVLPNSLTGPVEEDYLTAEGSNVGVR